MWWCGKRKRLKRIEEKLGDLGDKLDQLLKQGEAIMALVDDLGVSVAALKTAVDAAVALLVSLKAAVDAAGADPVKLAQLKTDIEAITVLLNDSVAASTPTP